MAQATTGTQAQGNLEALTFMLLSQAAAMLTSKKLSDCIVVVIPDTGKSQFVGSHEYTVKSGSKKGQTAMSKAIFKIAEHGGYVPDAIGFAQDNGDAKGLGLKARISIVANAPNENATTVAEARQVAPTDNQRLVAAAQPTANAQA